MSWKFLGRRAARVTVLVSGQEEGDQVITDEGTGCELPMVHNLSLVFT